MPVNVSDAMKGSGAGAGAGTVAAGTGTGRPSKRSWLASCSGLAHCEGGSLVVRLPAATVVAAVAEGCTERTGAAEMVFGARGPVGGADAGTGVDTTAGSEGDK